jgi:hypothetical protein
MCGESAIEDLLFLRFNLAAISTRKKRSNLPESRGRSQCERRRYSPFKATSRVAFRMRSLAARIPLYPSAVTYMWSEEARER